MFENTERKLKELSQFLKMMDSSESIDILEGYFSAFISAGRSVTFSLFSELKEFGGFSEWYTKKQEEMKEDELLKFFKDLRNVDIHTGRPNIKSSIFIKGPINSKEWKNRPKGSSIKITGRGVFYVENSNTPFERSIPVEVPNVRIHGVGFRNPQKNIKIKNY